MLSWLLPVSFRFFPCFAFCALSATIDLIQGMAMGTAGNLGFLAPKYDSLRAARVAALELRRVDEDILATAPKVLEQCLLGVFRPKVCDPTEIVDKECLDKIYASLETIQRKNEVSPNNNLMDVDSGDELLPPPSNDEFFMSEHWDVKLSKLATIADEFTVIVVVIPFTENINEQKAIDEQLEQWALEKSEEQVEAAILALSTSPKRRSEKFYVKTSDTSPISSAQIAKFYRDSTRNDESRNGAGERLLSVVKKIRDFNAFQRK